LLTMVSRRFFVSILSAIAVARPDIIACHWTEPFPNSASGRVRTTASPGSKTGWTKSVVAGSRTDVA
jgi:hypothetical protein